MPTLELETRINAPAETCFDLMRDVRVHTQTLSSTNEKAVDGVTNGLIGLGQTVTFEGRHFGMTQRMTVKVTEFDRPRRFVDVMIEGHFRSFVHIHEFEDDGKITTMRDTLIWRSPFGILGRAIDSIVLKKHMRDLVQGRNARLKQIAESI